jgi:hypothetical protein
MISKDKPTAMAAKPARKRHKIHPFPTMDEII